MQATSDLYLPQCLLMYALPATKRLNVLHVGHCSNGFPEIYRTQSNTLSEKKKMGARLRVAAEEILFDAATFFLMLSVTALGIEPVCPSVLFSTSCWPEDDAYYF